MFISFLSQRLKFKTITCLTIVTFTVLTITSCVSLKVNQIAIESKGEQPSINMKLYLKAPEKGQEDRVFPGVSTTLFFQQEDGTYAKVASSRQGSWILKNSPKGKYKIEIDRTALIDGKMETLKGSLTKTFTLKPGQRAEIRIVLQKVPVGLIVLGSVLVVGLIVLIIIINKDRLPRLEHLLLPPIPPFPRLVPPRGLVIPPLIFVPHGRLIPGPPAVFFDGGFYYYGPPSVDREPSYERPPTVDQGQPSLEPVPSGPSSPGELSVIPRQGQSKEQQAKDLQECHLWAVGQIGLDPTQPNNLVPQAQMDEKRADYKRAMDACLDARGYTLK